MDTDLIYRAVCTYGSAKRHGWEYQSGEYLEHVKHLLNEADEEHKSLLAENERLVDEVNELKAKLTDKASLLRGCYAADHKQKQRIEELTALLNRYRTETPLGHQPHMIAHLVDAALEKKHEGT